MCFVSVEWWLESHVFCFCRVAGKPCVLLTFCRVVAGMHGIKKFVCCFLAE